MSKQDLLSIFVRVLNKASSNKKELVYKIADILNIETESVYRRLAGTVKFSAYEIGVLAQSMNISLDSLLNEDSDKIPFFFQMREYPDSMDFDSLIDYIEELSLFGESINSQEVNVAMIYADFPMELFMVHPHLCKYMYFTWGHYFVATKEFNSFATWEIPERLKNAQNKFRKNLYLCTKKLQFWDISLMPRLLNEINYHLFIGTLTPNDVELIKKDLYNLLESFEEFVKGKDKQTTPYEDLDFECYVTNLSVGLTAYCILSNNAYMSGINSPFLSSVIHYDAETSLKIYKWIKSIKKISSLISGGCEKERVTFFRKQREIVNDIGVLRF